MSGRSVLNLAGSVGSGDYAFLDFMKGLKSLQAGTSAYPGSLTSTGYPNGTLSANLFGITQVPVSSTSTEDWIVDWVGQISTGANTGVRLDPDIAGLTVTSGASFVNGSTAFTLGLKGTNGKVQFNCSGHSVAQFTVNFLTTGDFSGFTSLRLYRAQDEATLNGGAIFYPPFVSVINQLNPKAIRFLDWAGINNSNYPTYALLPPTDNLAYGSPRWEPTAWVGTIAGTDTYTCSAPSGWGGLVDRAVVQGQWTNANTVTTPTLDVDGSGAKTIFRIGGQGALGNTGVAAGVIAANGLTTLVFDVELDAWLLGGSGFAVYVPLSVQVALCNEAGRDFWFQIPHLWSDAQVALAVAYIRDNLGSSLNCYIEWSNEVWNSIFSQTNYAYLRGLAALGALGTVRQVYGWYGIRVRETMEAATTAWSPRLSSQLIRVNAFQMAAATTNTTLRFNGADLASFGYNVAPDRPTDWTDVGSAAHYCSGAQIVNFVVNYANTMTDALDAADDYDSGDPVRMEAALDWIDSDIREGTRNGTLGSETLKALRDNVYPGVATLMATYSKPMACYEGGLECIAPTTAKLTSLGIDTAYAAKIDTLLVAYKNDDRCKEMVLDHYQDIVSAFGAGTLPAWYALLNQTTPIWQWGLYPSNLDSTPYKSFDAIVEWNSQLEASAPEPRQEIINQPAGSIAPRRRAQYESYEKIARRAKIAEIEELKTAILARGVIAPKMAEKVQEFVPYMDTRNIRTLVAELARVQQELEEEEDMLVLALLH